MGKKIIILILAILLVSTLYAEELTTPPTGDNADLSSVKASFSDKLGKDKSQEISTGDWSSVNPSLNFLKYIFGPIITPEGVNITSSMIITFAIWLLIFVSFSDIIANFSSFSKGISWVIGFCLGLIAANLGWTVSIIKGLTGAFAVLGTLSLFVALGAAFAAFLIINLGVVSLGWWVTNRRAMMEAHKLAGKAEAKGVELAGTFKAAHQIGKGIRDE